MSTTKAAWIERIVLSVITILITLAIGTAWNWPGKNESEAKEVTQKIHTLDVRVVKMETILPEISADVKDIKTDVKELTKKIDSLKP